MVRGESRTGRKTVLRVGSSSVGVEVEVEAREDGG